MPLQNRILATNDSREGILSIVAADGFLANPNKEIDFTQAWEIAHANYQKATKSHIIRVGGIDLGDKMAITYNRGDKDVATCFDLSIQFQEIPLMTVRFDYGASVINPKHPPKGVLGGRIQGPLYYDWMDNKSLIEKPLNEFPVFARKLSASAIDFRSTVQLMMNKCNISLTPGGMIPAKP